MACLRALFFFLFCVTIGYAESTMGDASEDHAALARIEENAGMIEKLQRSILQNSNESPLLRNQLVMQIAKKAKLADETAEIFLRYFLQRRISSSDPFLEKKLVLIHSILLELEQIKMGVDMALIDQLKKDVGAFKKTLVSQSVYLKPSTSDTGRYRMPRSISTPMPKCLKEKPTRCQSSGRQSPPNQEQ